MSQVEIEVTWTIVCSLGLVITAWALVDAVIDIRVIRRRHANGVLRTLAWGRLWSEVFGSLQLLLMTSIGVVALRAPNPPETTGARSVTALILIVVACLVTSTSILGRVTRTRAARHADPSLTETRRGV